MKAFLNDKFDRMGKERFSIIGPLVTLSSDILFIYYFTKILIPKQLTLNYIGHLIQKINQTHISPPLDMLEMMKDMIESSVMIALFGFFIFHCVIAYNVYRDGSFSKSYLKAYTGSTFLLSIVEFFMAMVQFNETNYFTLITMFLYGLAFYGFRYFQKQEQ